MDEFKNYINLKAFTTQDEAQGILRIERIPIGEKLQGGDLWLWVQFDTFKTFRKTPRTWYGTAQKVTKRHAPCYRILNI